MTLRHYATPVLFLAACGVTTDPADRSVAQTLCVGDVTCPACLERIAGGFRHKTPGRSPEVDARIRAAQARYWERRRKAGT